MSGVSYAQVVGIHLVSVHGKEGMNNFNPGVYARLDNGLTAGTYYNSHRRQSFYAGYTIETVGKISLALTGGVVTGYAKTMPLLVPSVAYKFSEATIRLGFIPKPPVRGSCSALHLMAERHF